MLNRTVRLAERPEGSGEPDAEVVRGLADGETLLAQMTRELAEATEQCSGERCEPLYEAEDAMLASAVSLAQPDLPQARSQEQDALASLIKARDTLRVILGKSSQAAMQAFRSFDRQQTQKLRPPKDKEEEEAELPSRLRRLADQEEIVYATLSGLEIEDAEPKPSGEQAEGGPSQGKEPDQMQKEIVDEAHAVRHVLDRVEARSDLATSRMDQATEKAEQVADALARGNSEEAARAAGEAEPMFRELAQHVEGLLAEEAAERIAAARDLAGKLAQRERELGDALPGDQSPTPSPTSPSRAGKPGAQDGPGGRGPLDDLEPADRAGRLAESGRTLEDLLSALAETDEEGGARAIREIRRLLREGRLRQAVLRMRQLEGLLKDGELQAAGVETRQLAEYLDALNLRLDTLHRLIVAPQLEELLALEKRAAALREELATLQTQIDIDQWHRAAEAFARELAELPVGRDDADGLLETMREAGWGDPSRSDWDWRFAEGGYFAPPGYFRGLDVVIGGLQLQIRELLLKDLVASDDEAAPPEYEELVDRYFQVLSQDIRSD